MLLPIENLLPPDEIALCREFLAQGPWLDGKETAGGQAAKVKANLQLDDSSESAARLRQIILDRLSVNGDFISAGLPHKIYPPKFNCYRNGGYYGLHVDNAIMQLTGGPLRTDVSATLFLSEPEDYEGGELVIESQYGVQEIKLCAGDMILYPSTSLHEVRPVTKGERVCAFFWVQSMVRESQHRELLFDLDQSIQQLTRERGAECPEVRRLTGVYHNLIRSWSEA